MALKAQSALEFIITYSWAFIIISLFVVSVILISDTKPPSVYLGSSCNIQPLLPCQESLLTYNSITPLQYYVVFTNQLGSVIYFPSNALNATTNNFGASGASYSLGNCLPVFASTGSPVLCTASVTGNPKISAGTQTVLTFTISYKICSSGTLSSCPPDIYRSSGFSTQTVAPSNIKFYNLTFVTNPSAGRIALNGVPYYNSISTYLTSGNYPIFGLAPQGYKFGSWSVNSVSSTVSLPSSQNSVLTISSNTVLTANFV